MGIFVSADRTSYRRWVNVLPSAIIAGAGQYLSGRRRAGLLWLICYVVYVGAKLFVKFSPFVKNPAIQSAFPIADGVFLVCVCLDACRRPIPRIGFKRWLSFIAVAAAFFLLPFFCLREFFFHPFYIPTAGMQPTLMGKTTAPDGHEEAGDSI